MASRLNWKINELERRMDQMVQKKVTLSVQFYEREIQKMFRLPKTGTVYGEERSVSFKTRGGRSASFVANRGKGLNATTKRRRAGVHQASAPGEPPAIDLGLLSKVTHKIEKVGWCSYKAQIGTHGSKYAAFLEYGTSRMAARPAWVPALVALQAHMPQIIGGE